MLYWLFVMSEWGKQTRNTISEFNSVNILRKCAKKVVNAKGWKNLGIMGLKETALAESHLEKLKCSMSSKSRMKLWMIRITTSVLIWICLVQLTIFGETWGPRVLKGWPPCLSHESTAVVAVKLSSEIPARVLPPKSKYQVFSQACVFLYDFSFPC